MPTTVVINDLTNVTVNGLPSGTVVDVLVNNPTVPDLRARLLDALIAHAAAGVASEKSRADEAIASATSAAQKSADEAVAKAQVAADEAVAAKTAAETASSDAVAAQQAAESEKAAEVARVASIVASLRSVPAEVLPDAVKQAMLTEAEKTRAALVAQKAEVEAKLAAL